MTGFVYKLMDKARNFSMFDFAIFKTTLLSAGILIGTYLASYIMSIIWLLWIIFVVSYLYMIYISFFRPQK